MRIPIPRNLGWKLGSLAVATMLWVAMSSEPEVVTTHIAPVVYRNIPPGYMVAGAPQDSVRIELRGPAGKLTPSALDPLAVTLDLSNVTDSAERIINLDQREDLEKFVARFGQPKRIIRAIKAVENAHSQARMQLQLRPVMLNLVLELETALL